ncbi:hypothetical protein Clacol_001750 [Clathrus columnatus]|uniref:Uncharacterized protein n=1 Tax=Clathrus columnatus TaxID=1419009 RepID=A0AAV5A234_9AGAM|nr:hypothetical protein Clacol_001750 [Clathrus columnatus]
MPEYVYALHDFTPEHDDELTFKAGDRIEVIEKDDLYGDGWWQGRNLTGKVGLFPQSYTSGTTTDITTIPDIHTPKLQPLQEESPEDVATLTPEPKFVSIPRDDSASSPPQENLTVMSATMTDVQRAIEQLAARRDTDDTSRSFSFASTNHDTESESEADREDDQRWHKDTRKALAERAQVENARKAKEEEEAMRIHLPPTLLEIPPIPIAAEVSDESDMEDDEDEASPHPHHRTDAEATTLTDATVIPQPLPPIVAPIPEHAQSELTPITATLTASTTSRSSPIDDTISSATSISSSVSLFVAAEVPLPKSPGIRAPSPISTPHLAPGLTIQTPQPQPHLDPATQTRTPVGTMNQVVLETPISAATITPYNADLSVINTGPSMSIPTDPVMLTPSLSPRQMPSHLEVQPITPPVTSQSPPTQMSQPLSIPSRPSSPAAPSTRKEIHPSEWTVEQVVEWLKDKGMDEVTCSKFIEHEITGDVLLELDTAMLKDEMGIAALGKRMRIQNGIIELKRPVSASIPFSSGSSSIGHSMAPNGIQSSMSGLPVMAGISHQQQYNFNGIPVPGMALGYTTVPTTVASPALSGSFNSGYGYACSGGGSGRTPSIESPANATGNGSPYATSLISEELGNGATKDGGGRMNKLRPAHLKLSPSDGALGETANPLGLASTREHDVVDKEDDRGVQSENEIPHSAISLKKRRLFGLSTESGGSSGSRKSGDSKEKDKTSTPTTPRSGSIRIGRSLTSGAAFRSRSPTPIGTRPSGESAGQTGDNSLVVVSATSSPSLGVKHAKNKKSFDGGLFGRDKLVDKEKEKEKDKEKDKGSDRLSFFGGKSRKPAPRYSVYEADTMAQTPTTSVSERHRSISRYITSGMGLSSSSGGKKNARPGTAPSGKNVPFGMTSANITPSGGKPGSGTITFTTSKDDSHITPSPPSTLLRKRHVSTGGPITPVSPVDSVAKKGTKDNVGASAKTSASGKAGKVEFQAGLSVLDQIGQPDHAGWLKKKGEKYNGWKVRYLVLKGPHLYYMKNADRTATKIKGYIKMQGYKIVSDESGPGKYGFKIMHETEPAHYFSSDELLTTREWMKTLMKATIERDYSKPVISSCNIPTIPLVVAQAMNPAPRPPSPTARDATQRALRRENPNQLSSRDARVLMGLPSTNSTSGSKSNDDEKAGLDTFFMEQPLTPPPVDEEATLVGLASFPSTKVAGNGNGVGTAPKRPSRNGRSASTSSNVKSTPNSTPSGTAPVDNVQSSEAELVDWANSLLSPQYKIRDVTTDLNSGLVLLRLAESIKGRPSEPSIPDSLFTGENNLDGMFKLFDFLLDNEVKMGGISINDINHGRRDKTIQLLKALKNWGEKRKALAKSIGKGSSQAGPWMSMESAAINW